MEITKVVKSFIKRGWPNTFGNIVYIQKNQYQIRIWIKSWNICQYPVLEIKNDIQINSKLACMYIKLYIYIYVCVCNWKDVAI